MPKPLFQGLVPPLLTPFTPDRRLDVPALSRVTEHLLTGVHGLFLLGTTAEFTQLDDNTTDDVLREAARILADRVPIAVHVTQTDRRRVQKLLQRAADIGASAVVVTAPYYFRPSQAELEQYVLDIISMSPLPVILYNMPHYTKVSFGMPLVRRLIDHPRVVGMKDSGGQIGYLCDVIAAAKHRPDFGVMVGIDYLFTECVRLGGHGAVIGSPSLAPQLCRRLFDAARAGRLDEVGPTQDTLNAITTRLFFGKPDDDLGVIKSIKLCCSLLGLCDTTMSWPHAPIDESYRDRYRQIMHELNLLA
jgi:2-dehydro-3-deoxy-D-pentonate aldolase